MLSSLEVPISVDSVCLPSLSDLSRDEFDFWRPSVCPSTIRRPPCPCSSSAWPQPHPIARKRITHTCCNDNQIQQSHHAGHKQTWDLWDSYSFMSFVKFLPKCCQHPWISPESIQSYLILMSVEVICLRFSFQNWILTFQSLQVWFSYWILVSWLHWS